MKVTWVPNDFTDRQGLLATPEEYDAHPPTPMFFMDIAPLQLHPDRVAIAATLLFGPKTSGRIEFAQGCSPAVAAEVSDYLRPVPVICTPVQQKARALPLGSGRGYVLENDERFTPPKNSYLGIRHTTVQSRRSDQVSGGLVGMDSVVVATNGFLFAPADGQASIASLATAVLFAESMRFDEIAVPKGRYHASQITAMRRLLSSSRLGLAEFEL